MRKKYFFIAGIVLLCLAGWGYHQFQKPRANIADKTPDVTIDALGLYTQFQANELAANKSFLDKIIAVKGEITDVRQTDTTLSIQLKAAETGGINCSVKIDKSMDYQHILTPKKGAVVTIKGLCTGYLMDVDLVDCALEKQ
jgi:hypothetical protein